MIQALRNAWRLPEVRNKLLYTGLLLLIYRFAASIPVVGVDTEAVRSILEGGGAGAGFANVLNLLSGGAISNFSVLANGVYPYITASIIFQLLVPVIPQLEAIQREPGGQEKIQRYTYFATIPMAVVQSVAQISIFSQFAGGSIIPGFGVDLLLTAAVIITMTGGTMFALWLGELITEEGIGNGISIIIFAGIVAQVPQNLASLIANSGSTGRLAYNLGMFVVIVLLSVIGIIYVQEGVRRIPVQYGKRVRGNRQVQGRGQFVPLRVNPVGMIPLIFSQAIITFPAVIIGLFSPAPGTFLYDLQLSFGNQSGFVYWATFFLLTVGFTFFYADVMVGNYNLAETLQRQGGFIPGIRPGARTEEYITRVTRRITLVGALFLGTIAIIPGIVQLINGIIFPLEASGTNIGTNPALVLTGSGLIIVVGVVIDTMRQLEAQLVMRNYEGFMR